MVAKVFVASNPEPHAVSVRPLPPRARHASLLAGNRRLMIVWVGAVFTPFLLQVRSYVQMVAPHKISQDLLALDADALSDQVASRCQVHGLYIAGVWWNIMPTHYYELPTSRICHFVVPQYNMHGRYHLSSDETRSAAGCKGETTPINYYFYHGSIGFCSFYEEGFGTVCSDTWTATIDVNKVGSFDMNGQSLADDRGSTTHRESYWFGAVGMLWILFRALVIRRSFILFKRHLSRCQHQHAILRLRDVIVYVQESARLMAYGASNWHRAGVIYLLLEGFMSDLFLFITKDGLSALIQCISLCYNLAGIISVLFEIVESSAATKRSSLRWSRAVRIMKRLFFNHETTMIGELLLVTVLQLYITTLNKSKMQDTIHVAHTVSYYLWGLAGHAIVAFSMVVFLFMVRSAGVTIVVWRKFRSLGPLTAPCCVEATLGIRQKLVLVTGYVWTDDCRLYYAKDSLTSYGLMMAEEDKSAGDKGQLLLVRERINWFAVPKENLVVLGGVREMHIEPCEEWSLPSAKVVMCDRNLGGYQSSEQHGEWCEDTALDLEVGDDKEDPQFPLLLHN